MKKFLEAVLVFAILLLMASTGRSQYHPVKTDPGNNNPPPTGALLDLSGQPVPGNGDGITYNTYTADFTATLQSTAITFAFREDPGFILFTNASVTDTTISCVEGCNLLQNGAFSFGTDPQNSPAPLHWVYTNQYGAAFPGVVQSGCGIYLYCWYDGAVQAYDAISQMIPTTVGHTYHISFQVADNTVCAANTICYFSDISTNGDNATPGGNGRNVTVYAQGGLPPAGASQTVTLQFGNSGGHSVTQVAPPSQIPTDPIAQSLALTLASVINPINVSVTFFYEPTDVSTGAHGIGIADGICEHGANETQDFDCRLAGTFTYPDNGTLIPPGVVTAGDKLVPHIIPSHNNLGVWLRVVATLPDGSTAMAGRDYTGPVDWYYAFNTNPPLVLAPVTTLATTTAVPGPVNPEYPAGWNNMSLQGYDRPGLNADGTPTDIAFIKNATTYSKNCGMSCVGSADPGVGIRTPTLNDVVIAAPPNPPGGFYATLEPLVPVPGISPFPYVKTLPMLVTFELENESKETSIGNAAVTLPHSVSVATFDPNGINIPVQFVRGFPTTVTYNPFFKTYYIFLNPAPYASYPRGTVFTLQINSDLISQPVTATFIVKNNQFE